MQIMAETKSLEELMPMRGNNAYIIPEYQRYYSWGEEQIEQLFNDIQQEDLDIMSAISSSQPPGFRINCRCHRWSAATHHAVIVPLGSMGACDEIHG
jgi:hypothetical protein